MSITLQRSKVIFAELQNGLSLRTSDEDEIFEVFSAFSKWEAHLIEQAIDRSLQQNPDGDSNDVFNETFIYYLSKKDPEINTAMEHDMESWITDASEFLAEAYLRKIESYLRNDGAASYREKIEFIKKIDFQKCVDEVDSILNESLAYMRSAIETIKEESSQSLK